MRVFQETPLAALGSVLTPFFSCPYQGSYFPELRLVIRGLWMFPGQLKLRLPLILMALSFSLFQPNIPGPDSHFFVLPFL